MIYEEYKTKCVRISKMKTEQMPDETHWNTIIIKGTK